MAAVVRLERFGEEHLEAFARMIHDPLIQRFTTFPSPPPPRFPRDWLDKYEAGRRDGTREVFAVVPPEGGELLGVAVAFGVDREQGHAELGYVVAPEARGRGVATEALRWLTRWAFDELGMFRLQLVIGVDNEASRRVAAKCGYVYEGTLRGMYAGPGRRGDGEMWSRLVTDTDGT